MSAFTRDEILDKFPLDQYCHDNGIKLFGNGPKRTCRCPLHDDRTPSCTVDLAKKVWHCLPCDKGGTVIDLHAYLKGWNPKVDFAKTIADLLRETTRDNIVAEYNYNDESGALLYQIVRLVPKSFRIRRRVNGEWVWKQGDVCIVPYHLDEVVKATNEIYITEGEKDADTLRKLKLVATCNPFGAEKWRPEFDAYFKNRDIIICPDADEAGQKHCLQVGKNLLPVANKVSVVILPPGLKDVTDLYENDREAFFKRLQQAVSEAKPFADFQHGPNGGKPKEDNEPPFQWADPQLLEDYYSPVLPINREMMPGSLWDWIADVAHRVRCPIDFVTVSAVVMTGAVCAARVRIRPGHYATWEIAPNLWGGVVGPPGSKKTPATSEIFKTLARLEIKESDNHEKNMVSHKAALAEHSAELKALRSIIDRLRKQRLEGKSKLEDAEKEDTLKKQLEDFLKNEPQPPVQRWFRINDPTIEALQDILKQDFNCILHERDELTGMLAQWEMDGHQMDRAFYLESWNGTNPYKGKRIGRGDFFIPLLCLSLFGGIQSVKLIQYLRNPQTNLTHDGAMQRFQALVYPDPPTKRKHVDQYENTDAKNRFHEVLKKLAYADFRDYGGLTDEFNKTPWFHFHAEAKTLFEDWLAANEEKTDNKNEDPALREHLSKFPKLFCSLSLIFHLIELADTGKHETYIPLRIAQMAAEWCAYLESHARRIYSLVKTPSLFSAMALADKITDPSTKTPLENRFTSREVFRRKWSGVDSYELIHAALARLEEANWIRGVVVPPSKNGGRPTVHYEINPEIIHRRDARKGAE